MAKMTGTITQIIGPVIDVQVEQDLPQVDDALTITRTDKSTLTLEVEQQLSTTEVRAIALGPTEGLVRGMEVKATGNPISVPVGDPTLGRIFNVVGEAID